MTILNLFSIISSRRDKSGKQQVINLNSTELKKWKESFDLHFNWKEKLSPMVASTLALSTLSEDIDTGYYLAKQIFNITEIPQLNQNLILTSRLKKAKAMTNMSYVKCQVKVNRKNKELINITSTLIKTKKKKSQQGEPFFAKSQSWRKINTTQIYKFSQYSSDPNQIHLTQDPVIQGMLLLLTLEDHLASHNKLFKQATITYSKPIKSNNQINLSWAKENELLGIVNNQICFKLTIKEEF
ncbi:hypothetical protein Halha_0242 [Halobacteroides halobius DSM 5150]|uniref:Acyl dehydratase n=1 Tax=Halobacteroides halobius (strain ATCC 35273 / DSM 5150 / MD-1) TaxID=748449 RepID=L0K7B6_HALHC|nr:hypothetical protein [Halobacteroides halobius]AGB40254.1 hypothetical protein Halha_0242 [Halobacteroides halobius DSM 5150]